MSAQFQNQTRQLCRIAVRIASHWDSVPAHIASILLAAVVLRMVHAPFCG